MELFADCQFGLPGRLALAKVSDNFQSIGVSSQRLAIILSPFVGESGSFTESVSDN
jgi:hypothetical protein